MIKLRRTTRTVIIFEQAGEMHDLQSETDVMIVVPKWATNGLKKILRAAYLAKLEIKAWRSPDISLLDKICYGYQLAV